MLKKLNKKGFTLVELLAVIVILGVIMLIAIPSVGTIIKNSKENSFVSSGKMYISSAQNLVSGDFSLDDTKSYYYTINTIKDASSDNDLDASPIHSSNKIKGYVVYNPSAEGANKYKAYITDGTTCTKADGINSQQDRKQLQTDSSEDSVCAYDNFKEPSDNSVLEGN